MYHLRTGVRLRPPTPTPLEKRVPLYDYMGDVEVVELEHCVTTVVSVRL